jgi:hypothetical protein
MFSGNIYFTIVFYFIGISQLAGDIELYTLKGGLESIQAAMKLFRKRNIINPAEEITNGL